MRVFIKVLILSLIPLLFSCEVTFDDTLGQFVYNTKNGTGNQSLELIQDNVIIENDGSPFDFEYPDDIEVEFTLRNLGSSNLTISGITIFGDGFALNTDETDLIIEPDGNTSIIVQYNNDGNSERITGKISIISDSSTGTEFIMNLIAGVEDAVAETFGAITVSIEETDFTNDGTAYDFGYLKIGTSASVSITITNTGNDILNISSIILDMEGLGEFPYTLDTTEITFPASILQNETLLFDAVFQPTVNDTHERILSVNVVIGNDDPDNGSFKLNLTGTGETPELTVLHNSIEYTDNGDPVYFDVAATSSSDDETITLRNDSNVDLVISSVTSSASPFSIADSAITIAAGETATITPSFSPIIEGGFDGIITIESDDVDESSFELNMRGGTTYQQMFNGLRIWLNGDQVQTDGGYVTQWTDQSGTNYHALPLAITTYFTKPIANGGTNHTARMPEFETATGIAGKNAVRFVDEDGSTRDNTLNSGDTDACYNGDALYIIGSGTYFEEMTVFIFFRPETVNSRCYSYGSNGPYLRIEPTYFYNYFRGLNLLAYDYGGASLGTNYLVTNLVDSNADEIRNMRKTWVNTQLDSETSPLNMTIRTYAMFFGNYANNFNLYAFDGLIWEIIIYERALSDSEIELMHNYIEADYGQSW